MEVSVQSNHVHMLVEGADRERVARGMQGLCIRIAKGLNRLWRRGGAVFADRYHDVVLRTPRQVRNALVYVLQNGRKHGARFASVDPCSSGPWFPGWLVAVPEACVPRARPPTAEARTWLLARGWRRYGALAWSKGPRAAPER